MKTRLVRVAAVALAACLLATPCGAFGQVEQTYTWTGAVAGGTYDNVSFNTSTDEWIYTPVSLPKTVTVVLDYEYIPGAGPEYATGNSSVYPDPFFSFSIIANGSSAWGGFSSAEMNTITVTPATGNSKFDSITFSSENLGRGPAITMDLTILAPAGTLQSGALPPDLTAFEQWGAGPNNFGGSWNVYYGVNDDEGFAGGVFGILGVPEPSSVVLMAIGVVGTAGLVWHRRRGSQRAKQGACAKTTPVRLESLTY